MSSLAPVSPSFLHSTCIFLVPNSLRLSVHPSIYLFLLPSYDLSPSVGPLLPYSTFIFPAPSYVHLCLPLRLSVHFYLLSVFFPSYVSILIGLVMLFSVYISFCF